jgi:hypothetical protein
VRLRQHFPHRRGGAAGVDEIVDDQDACAPLPAGLRHRGGDVLQHRRVALVLVVVIRGDADRLDDADLELARDDRRRHEPAAGDADERRERASPGEPPGERPRVAVELLPGDPKGFFARHHAPSLLRSTPLRRVTP